MDKFYIITNGQKDTGMQVTRQVAAYLEERGCYCGVQKLSGGRMEGLYRYRDPGRSEERRVGKECRL